MPTGPWTTLQESLVSIRRSCRHWLNVWQTYAKNPQLRSGDVYPSPPLRSFTIHGKHKKCNPLNHQAPGLSSFIFFIHHIIDKSKCFLPCLPIIHPLSNIAFRHAIQLSCFAACYHRYRQYLPPLSAMRCHTHLDTPFFYLQLLQAFPLLKFQLHSKLLLPALFIFQRRFLFYNFKIRN